MLTLEKMPHDGMNGRQKTLKWFQASSQLVHEKHQGIPVGGVSLEERLEGH